MKKFLVGFVMFLAVSGFVFGATYEDWAKMPSFTNTQLQSKLQVAESLLKGSLTKEQKDTILLFLAHSYIKFDKAKALYYVNQLETLRNKKITLKGFILYKLGKNKEAISYFKPVEQDKNATVGKKLYVNWLLYNIGIKTNDLTLAKKAGLDFINDLFYSANKKTQQCRYREIKPMLPVLLKDLNISEQVNLLIRISTNFDYNIKSDFVSLAVSKVMSAQDLSTVEKVSLLLKCEKILSITDNADLISQIFSNISRMTGIKDVNEYAVEKWLKENK